jgi:hypothetical protein
MNFRETLRSLISNIINDKESEATMDFKQYLNPKLSSMVNQQELPEEDPKLGENE